MLFVLLQTRSEATNLRHRQECAPQKVPGALAQAGIRQLVRQLEAYKGESPAWRTAILIALYTLVRHFAESAALPRRREAGGGPRTVARRLRERIGAVAGSSRRHARSQRPGR